MPTVFFSYCHKDEVLRDRLETSLSAMKRQKLIDTWHDRRITAGQSFGDRIAEELERADVILLLVSPDFIDSDYCYEKEMSRALELHAAGEAVVIPVILRPSDWHHLPFGHLLAAPTDGRPVTKWPDQDEAFLDVTTKIRRALEDRGARPKTGSATAAAPAAASTQWPVAAAIANLRSSNLSVRKNLTDADRDRFLDDTFDFIARFFEGSLHELKDRNPDIDTNFRRVDANTFTATIYRGGASASQCKIVRGGMYGQGISYSMATAGNGINESLSVGADAHGFFMKAMGMGIGRPLADKNLTQDGAAEYYWGILMEPLQRGK